MVPFGEKVLYRLPEVANDRHQALEERWAHGIWLGHARHSPEVLIATNNGITKSWAIRRLPAGQQWDAEMVSRVKGSPTNCNWMPVRTRRWSRRRTKGTHN